MTSEDS